MLRVTDGAASQHPVDALRVAVISAGVSVGPELLAALAPYRPALVSERDLAGVAAAGIAAFVVVAAEDHHARRAVLGARAAGPDVPVLVIAPRLDGIDQDALCRAGAADAVAYSRAASSPLALVLDATRRVHAMRARLRALDWEIRSYDEASEAHARAAEVALASMRNMLTALGLGLREVGEMARTGHVEPALLASMEVSLRRLRSLVEPLEAFVRGLEARSSGEPGEDGPPRPSTVRPPDAP